ncbi:hypothetical protein AVEN_206968-1 [Araneus ventricosus]|uniref:Uncharacterized protein n=1 Tax=Araneus ventricosus TaxID=182803 RepID=A0A4Y2S599_ARAVE|nr:hypothetical protein AVEN_206968-1 [Araneus ventricosus]
MKRLDEVNHEEEDLKKNKEGGSDGLVVILGIGVRGFHIRNPIPLKIRRVWSLLHVKSYVLAKPAPPGVVGKFQEREPAHLSSSSFHSDSKL